MKKEMKKKLQFLILWLILIIISLGIGYIPTGFSEHLRDYLLIIAAISVGEVFSRIIAGKKY